MTTNIKKGRGKSQKSITLINTAIRILEDIQPASVRAVCYRLFIEKLIPSMSKANTNAVGTQLVWAREQGHIPWEWIVDESRKVERINTWKDPESIIRAAVRGYRKNYWSTQPVRIEVWSEKGTVRGTLAPVLDEFGVDFRVMHGFGSATTLHDIAELSVDSDKPMIAFYVGDWDPSGLCMSEIDLPKRIERYGGDVEIVRIALIEADVMQGTGLPYFDLESKANDSRSPWFKENYGSKCWELDAMSPVILRERLRVFIMNQLDQESWDQAIKVETAEKESMSSILDNWKKSISMQAKKCSVKPS